MRSTRSLLVLLLFTLLTGAGCAGTRKLAPRPTALPDAFPNHTAAQIQERLHLSPDTLFAFTANASISVSSPTNSGQFNARIDHRRNDSLYLSIRVTLGIEAARALVTADSFFVYDRIQKQLIYGSLDYTANLLPAPFASTDLFPNLLGLLTPDPLIAWRVRADSSSYYLEDPAGRYAYTVDPALWRVIRYEERSASGMIIETRDYSEFDRFQNLYLPRRIIFRRPQEDTVASIYYRSLDLNPPALSFDLRLREGVRRIPAYELQ